MCRWSQGRLSVFVCFLFFYKTCSNCFWIHHFSNPIILLPLPISLLLTLHDFSPTCKVYALFYNVSHALKNVLSHAVTRAARSNLPPRKPSCNSHHVNFKYRLLLLSLYYLGCLPNMSLITQGHKK